MRISSDYENSDSQKPCSKEIDTIYGNRGVFWFGVLGGFCLFGVFCVFLVFVCFFLTDTYLIGF